MDQVSSATGEQEAPPPLPPEHMHRAVWPEATVGQHSSPSREETQTHEGQVETVSHVEEPLVQTGAEAGITWGNRWGGSGAEHPPLGPASGSSGPSAVAFYPHVWGAASSHTSSLHATQNGFISDDPMLNPTSQRLRP